MRFAFTITAGFAFLIASIVGADVPVDRLDDLDHPDWNTRERAMQSLMDDPAVTEDDLLKLLSDRDQLTPEQIDRLQVIAEQRAMQAPAAIGIQMNAIGGEVVIDRVYDQAPASRVLQRGDIIRRVDDIDLSTLPDPVGVARFPNPAINPAYEAIRRVTASKRPGQFIRMVVLRNGVELRVDVELANANQLDEFQGGRFEIDRIRHWRDLNASLLPHPILLPLSPSSLLSLRERRYTFQAAPSSEMAEILEKELVAVSEDLLRRMEECLRTAIPPDKAMADPDLLEVARRYLEVMDELETLDPTRSLPPAFYRDALRSTR